MHSEYTGGIEVMILESVIQGRRAKNVNTVCIVNM
jgi:hypothetical protein